MTISLQTTVPKSKIRLWTTIKLKISLQTTALKLKTTHQNPHQSLLRFRKRSQAKMKRRKQRKKKRKKREKRKRKSKRRKNNSPLKNTSPKKRRTPSHPKIKRRSPLRLIRRKQRKKKKRDKRKSKRRKRRKNISPLKSINLKKRRTPSHPKIKRRSPLRLIRRKQRKKKKRDKRKKNNSPLKSINVKKRKTPNLLTNHQNLKISLRNLYPQIYPNPTNTLNLSLDFLQKNWSELYQIVGHSPIQLNPLKLDLLGLIICYYSYKNEDRYDISISSTIYFSFIFQWNSSIRYVIFFK